MPDNPKPPDMPPFNRGLNIPPYQMIGMALMFIIPVLALLGVFGNTQTSSQEEDNVLDVEVIYPTRLRYKMIDSLIISVENTSNTMLDTITVEVDQDYISRFSTVQFTPSVKSVTNDAYIVELSDVAPGETRIVSVMLQAEQYGPHAGTVNVYTGDREPLRFSIETFSIP